MENVFGDIQLLIQHNPWLAVVAVFLGGVMTAANPCVLAMIPLMIGMVAGKSGTAPLKKTFFFSLFFIFGLAVTFTALGLVSSLLGRMFGNIGGFWKYVVVAVCLVMGVQLLGAFKLNFAAPKSIEKIREGGLGAFLLGLLFGVVSTPCAVPVLAVLLAFVANQGNVVYGGFLLFVYALGHSLLILIAGTSMGAAKTLIESRGWGKANAVMQKIAGVVIILVGIYFLFNRPLG